MRSSVHQLIRRTVDQVQRPTASTGGVVHLALSGGVDSSVAGLLLKESGWDVRPVLMRCWADADDNTATPCFEREVRACEDAVQALGLERQLAIFDFVPDYWTRVFDQVFLKGLASGITPNQDLACNSAIKFGAFPERLAAEASLGRSPPFATGHYARLLKEYADEAREVISKLRLLSAVDKCKDQSYFLATVPGACFEQAIFPIGTLLKTEVREIAAHAGLPAASQPSSRGICFVGKRRIGDFASQFLPDIATGGKETTEFKSHNRSGHFLKLHSQSKMLTKLGDLPYPAYSYTLGQRARIGGQPKPLYVVGRQGQDVILNEERLHVCQLICDPVMWTGDRYPQPWRGIQFSYKGSSCAAPRTCTIEIMQDGKLLVKFTENRQAIAPGQAIVIYRGNEVLCSALVCKENYDGLLACVNYALKPSILLLSREGRLACVRAAGTAAPESTSLSSRAAGSTLD